MVDIHAKLGWRLIAYVLISAIAAGTDGLRIGLGLLLLPYLGVELDNPLDPLVRGFLEYFDIAPEPIAVISFVCIAFVVQAAIALFQSWSGAGYSNYYVFLWRRAILSSHVRANWRFLLETPSSRLQNALSEESLRLRSAAVHLLSALSDAMVILVFIAAAFAAEPTSAFLLTVFGSGVFVANYLLSRPIVRRSRTIVKGNLMMVQIAGDLLRNIKSIKAAGDPSDFERIFMRPIQRLMKDTRLAMFVTGYSRVVSELAVLLAIVGAVVFSVSFDFGQASGQLLVVLLFFFRAATKATSALTAVQRVNTNIGAFEFLQSAWRSATDAAEDSRQSAKQALTFGNGSFRDCIAFNAISVHHEKLPALEQVSLVIPKGKTTAIVGPSGAGKTTLVDTLLRLYEPDDGRILVDGRPITEFDLRSWRSAIGYVSQDTTMMNETIFENIRLHRPDATEEEVVATARASDAHEFILATPRGYHTNIGDMGLKLSGGQRQRLSLARALLSNPSILILDEATSALDTETEDRVMASLQSTGDQMTIIHIAHRLSTVQKADLIHVLSGGRLIESGGWDSLISGRGLFHDLWRRQIRTAS